MTIKWLSTEVNPPKLDTEIIVKSTTKPNYGYKGIYCEIKFYDSEMWSEEEMIDLLIGEQWNLWSNVE